MSGSKSTSRLWWAAGAAAVLWAAAYGNSLNNSFHFDDDHVIERNLYIRSLSNIPKFFQDARTFSTFPPNANYRPLESTTLAIDYAIAGGLRPLPFHITQLLLFLLDGVLFFFIARTILRKSGEAPWQPWAALFATALFCLHIGNTEPANYISSRSEQLSTAGILGAFLVYMRWPKLRKFFLYLIPMFIGALAKPPAIVFAPLLVVYKILFEANPTREWLKTMDGWRRIGRAVLTSVPALIVAGLTFKFVEGMSPTGQNYGGGSRTDYLRTQTFVWLRYVKLFFIPTGFAADTDWALIPNWADWRVVAGTLTLIVSLVVAVFFALRPVRRPVAFGIVWFWLGIAPTSTIFPLAEATNDHRMFLGWLGLSLAVSAYLFERAYSLTSSAHKSWRPILEGLAVAVLLAHAIGVHQRNLIWRDEEALWTDSVEAAPNNGRAWMNYGLTQMAHARYPKAKEAFDRAEKLTPFYSVLAVNQAILASATGNDAEAERNFKRSLTLIPKGGEAPFFYGRYLVDKGRAAEAAPYLREAAKIDWGDARPRRILIELAAARGDTAEVREIAAQTLAIGPDAEAQKYLEGKPAVTANGDTAKAWFDSGLALTNQKRHALAAQAYRLSVQRDPKDADSWNNLGWSLYSLGFFADAVEPYKHARDLRPTDDRARNNLAETLKRAATIPAAQRTGRL